MIRTSCSIRCPAPKGRLKGPGALNLSFYRNPHLDDLLIRGSQLSFAPERLRVYSRAQSLLADEVPWIPLYVQLHWVIARPEVQNLRLHPSGAHRLDRVTLEPEGRWTRGGHPRPLDSGLASRRA